MAGLLTLAWVVVLGATDRLVAIVLSLCLGGSLAASSRAEEPADADNSNGLFAGTKEADCEGLETLGADVGLVSTDGTIRSCSGGSLVWKNRQPCLLHLDPSGHGTDRKRPKVENMTGPRRSTKVVHQSLLRIRYEEIVVVFLVFSSTGHHVETVLSTKATATTRKSWKPQVYRVRRVPPLKTTVLHNGLTRTDTNHHFTGPFLSETFVVGSACPLRYLTATQAGFCHSKFQQFPSICRVPSSKGGA